MNHAKSYLERTEDRVTDVSRVAASLLDCFLRTGLAGMFSGVQGKEARTMQAAATLTTSRRVSHANKHRTSSSPSTLTVLSAAGTSNAPAPTFKAHRLRAPREINCSMSIMDPVRTVFSGFIELLVCPTFCRSPAACFTRQGRGWGNDTSSMTANGTTSGAAAELGRRSGYTAGKVWRSSDSTLQQEGQEPAPGGGRLPVRWKSGVMLWLL